MLYCKECGEELDPKSKFCMNCGASQEEEGIKLESRLLDSKGTDAAKVVDSRNAIDSSKIIDVPKKKRIKGKIVIAAIFCIALMSAGAYVFYSIQQTFFNDEVSSAIEKDNSSNESAQLEKDSSDEKAEISGKKDINLTKVLLKDINVFNFQCEFVNGRKSIISGSTVPVIAADGKLYEEGITFDAGREYGYKYIMDFLIDDQDYSKFKAEYLLSDEEKSYTGAFIVKIIGDDTNVLYQSSELTGGFTPEKIDINVKGISKLSIVIESPVYDDYLGGIQLVFKEAGLYL